MKFNFRKTGISFANIFPFLAAILTFVLVEWGSGHPEWIEKYYSKFLSPTILPSTA